LLVSSCISLYLQAQHGLRASWTVGVSLLAGGFAWAAIGLLASAAGRWREHAAIRSGAAGVAPVDGRATVLVGTLQPLGTPLRAPLDDTPCVAYSYAISIDRGSGRRRTVATIARGTGLTPSVVVTSTGSYKLLVVPEIEADEPTTSREQQLSRFLEYAGRTTFTPRAGSADELLAQWDDTDGDYRSDVAYAPLDSIATSHWILAQRHVPVGTRACVFGRYSRSQGGIVNPLGGVARIVGGSPERVAASLRSKSVFRAGLGVAFAAAAMTVVSMFLAG
jgi:hypothetical protein